LAAKRLLTVRRFHVHHDATTAIVRGAVMAKKYQIRGDSRRISVPSSSNERSKKTVLKMACVCGGG
jgi:hypothetical protein